MVGVCRMVGCGVWHGMGCSVAKGVQWPQRACGGDHGSEENGADEVAGP